MDQPRPDVLPAENSMRARHVGMIALGGVIGAGFFVGSSNAIAMAGPGILLTYALAGVMVLLINLMLRDVALAAPEGGSFVSQVHRHLGPHLGFFTGWSYLVIWIITTGVETIGAATLLVPYIPLPYPVLEFGLLLIMTANNLLSVRHYAESEYWLAIIKVAAIAVFIFMALAVLGMGIPLSDTPRLSGGLLPHGLAALLAAAPTVVFSMSGSEVASIAALESDRPDANIRIVARSVALRIGGFYLASIALILCVVSWRDIVPGHSPFLLVLDRLHVPFASEAMTAIILTAMLSTVNSGLYATSRILRSLASQNQAPAFFDHLAPGRHLPRRAVLACACAVAMVAASAIASPGFVFGFLISMIGSFIIFDDILIVLVRMKLRAGPAWQGWLALVLLMTALASMCLEPETRRELATSVAAVVVIFAAAWIVLRHSAAPRPGNGRSAP